jgi:basic membrane protein A
MSNSYLTTRKNIVAGLLIVSLAFSASVTLSSSSNEKLSRKENTVTQQFDASIGIVLPLIDRSDYELSENHMMEIFNKSKDELSKSYEINWDVRLYSELDQLDDEILNISGSNHDLIITIGFFAVGALEAAAVQYPNTNFALIDAVSDKSNIASITFKDHESSFLVGALSAMVSNSKHVGFLGAIDIPIINAFRSGYEQGARYINPQINISSSYSPDQNNPWQDPEGGSNVADQMLNEGVDVFFAAADRTGMGFIDRVITAAESGEVVYANGIDINMDGYAPGAILTSTIKRYETAISSQVASIISDSWTAGVHEMGIKENGVGITSMEYTQDKASYVCDDGRTRYDVIQDIVDLVSSGSIVIDNELQGPADYNTEPHLCDEIVTDSNDSNESGDSNVTNDSKDSDESDDSSLPYNAINWIITLIGISVLNKMTSSKRKRE